MRTFWLVLTTSNAVYGLRLDLRLGFKIGIYVGVRDRELVRMVSFGVRGLVILHL